MAVLQSYQSTAGNREDLIPVITMISPDDAPFLSSIATKKSTGMKHEWLTDALSAPTANAQVEGSVAAFGTLTPRVRVDNIVQNIRKTGSISDNQEAVLKAGIKSEYSYQLEKATKEIALDTERAMIQGAYNTGSSVTAQTMGGLFSFLQSNQVAGSAAVAATGAVVAATATSVTVGAGHGAVVGSYVMITQGAGGGTTTGQGQYRIVTAVAANVLTVAAWDVIPTVASNYAVFAAPAALTETKLNDAFETCYLAGGHPDCIMAPTKQKRAISNFASSVRRLTASESKITNSIDVYESDFGVHQVKTNRWMPAGSLAVLEKGQFAAAYLRPVKAEELARRGSSRDFMIESAVTLEARAENSSALILGLL